MTGEQRFVLDASALLALLFREPGTERVRDVLRGSVMSAVNWAEVLHVTVRRGGDTHGLREDLGLRGLSFVPFEVGDADLTEALLRTNSDQREQQLSLADRACLALARRLGLPALAGDRVWADIDVGVEVRLFRNASDA